MIKALAFPLGVVNLRPALIERSGMFSPSVKSFGNCLFGRASHKKSPACVIGPCDKIENPIDCRLQRLR